MNNAPPPGQVSLPLSLDRRLEEVCGPFEAAWKNVGPSDPPPRIEEHLPDTAAGEGSVFLKELVELDLYYRRRRGESPRWEEYCEWFPQLPDRVRRLLEASLVTPAQPPSGLGKEPGLLHQRDSAPENPATPAIPGYQILGKIGRGGMGVVYRARQCRLDRIVALKMILAGELAGAEELARFRTEAEAVARLQHPNIVQIFEVGEQNGQPFLSLEFVVGGSLAEHLAGNLQPAGRAAELVEALAQAAHHAHVRGIVHRDLKPANVLLTADSVPKIVDFGLAKRLDAGVSGQTQTGAIMGTPSYMAPEQALGAIQQIGPVTDVYALGAVLYEMLTGRPPFRGENVLETLEQVRNVEPVPPSRLQPKIPRDLETICLTCLQKDPARRYAGADALAEDLRRFRNGEPIQARPIGRVERLWRWGRKNPLAAGLLTALALVFLSGFSGVAVQWRRAEANLTVANGERHRAEENFTMALKAVDDYLTTISESKLLQSPLPGLQPLRKDLLTTALRYYQTFVDQRQDDPTLQAELAKAQYRVGRIQYELGEYTEALKALEKSRDLWEKLLGDHTTDAGTQTGLAEVYLQLGLLKIRGVRQPVESLQALEHACSLYEQLISQSPADVQLQDGLARCYTLISLAHEITNQESEQLRCLEKALSIRESLVRMDSNYTADLGTAYLNIGFFYAKNNQLSKAMPNYLMALEIIEQLARDKPSDSILQAELGRAYLNVGFGYDEMGKYQEALTYFEKSRAVCEKVARVNPEVVEFQARRAGPYFQIAVVYFHLCQFEKTAAFAQQAIKSSEEAIRIAPKAATAQSVRAYAYLLLGKAKQALNEHEAALEAFRQCLAIGQEIPGSYTDENSHQFRSSQCWNGIANEQYEIGQYAESVRSQQTAIQILEKLPDKKADLAQAYVDLGMVYLTTGQQKDALRLVQTAREILEKLPELNSSGLFSLALVRAVSSDLVGLGKTMLTATEQAERNRFANEAMEALRRAVAKGYRDLTQLKGDRRLEALRTRGDFQKLLTELEEKNKADFE